MKSTNGTHNHSAPSYTPTYTLVRELATTAASNGVNPSPAQPQLRAKEETIASQPPDNSWSNMLGLWAWKKEAKKEVVPVKANIEEANGKS